MNFPLISPDWDFALWAVLIGIAGFGFWADSTRIGKQVSGVAIMLVVAMIFGNLGGFLMRHQPMMSSGIS